MIYGVAELLYDASTLSLSKIVKYESEFHLDCSAIIWIFVFGNGSEESLIHNRIEVHHIDSMFMCRKLHDTSIL